MNYFSSDYKLGILDFGMMLTIDNDYKFTNYMLDNDICNFNRFIINYLKNENNFFIDLEKIFKLIKESKGFRTVIDVVSAL
jgi:hypothetical protein